MAEKKFKWCKTDPELSQDDKDLVRQLTHVDLIKIFGELFLRAVNRSTDGEPRIADDIALFKIFLNTKYEAGKVFRHVNLTHYGNPRTIDRHMFFQLLFECPADTGAGKWLRKLCSDKLAERL